MRMHLDQGWRCSLDRGLGCVLDQGWGDVLDQEMERHLDGNEDAPSTRGGEHPGPGNEDAPWPEMGMHLDWGMGVCPRPGDGETTRQENEDVPGQGMGRRHGPEDGRCT